MRRVYQVRESGTKSRRDNDYRNLTVHKGRSVHFRIRHGPKMLYQRQRGFRHTISALTIRYVRIVGQARGVTACHLPLSSVITTSTSHRGNALLRVADTRASFVASESH